MKKNAIAYTNLTLAMVIVGSSVVFGKIITNSFPVFLASGLRFAIASIVMVPILLKTGRLIPKLNFNEFLELCLMAFCGQFIFTVLLLLGLRHTSGIEAGIITSTSPAVMAGVSYLLFREKAGIKQVAGILMVLAGVIIINGFLTPKNMDIGSVNLFGNLLVIGAVVGEAFFLLMRKRISPSVSNMELTGYLCFLGFLMFLPFSIYQSITFDFTKVSVLAWGSMLYFGAVFTVLAYIFWFNGVAKVTGSVAGVFTAVMPISAVGFSLIFLKESFTLEHALGGGLILGAILLITTEI